MTKHQTNAINTSATSKQVRESTDRELTADELAHVSGGTNAVGSVFFKAAAQGTAFKRVGLGL